MKLKTASLALVFTLAANAALAEDKPEGFLCCNMRTDGAWISDISYTDNGTKVLPLGTPTKVTGYGRYRVYIEVDGKKQSIGNDYSRDLDLETFAKRYVVKDDPKLKLAGWPARVQEAIKTGHLSKGMTREQVLMSVGYPVSSETPDLNAKVWRYWLSSFSEYRVRFDAAGKVSGIEADASIEDRVIQEP
jgi:hypothetical protein